MSISETTVSEYRKRIRRRLGLHSTAELAACARMAERDVSTYSSIGKRRFPVVS